MIQPPSDEEVREWLKAASMDGLDLKRLRAIAALGPDGNLAPVSEWLTEAEEMGIDLEGLRKFGVLHADGTWVPLREWPEFRQKRFVQAIQLIRLNLGSAILRANPGIEKLQ